MIHELEMKQQAGCFKISNGKLLFNPLLIHSRSAASLQMNQLVAEA